MGRTLILLFGLMVLLGCGVVMAAWPQDDGIRPRPPVAAPQLAASYNRVRTGFTPASQLQALGFDTMRARRLTYLGAMEQFMPRDPAAFDTLDPAMQTCLQSPDQCTAYIFSPLRQPSAQVVILIEGGRVTYKAMRGFESEARGAANRTPGG